MFAGDGPAVLERPPRIRYENFEEYKIEHKLKEVTEGPREHQFSYIFEDDNVDMKDIEFQLIGSRGQLPGNRKHS